MFKFFFVTRLQIIDVLLRLDVFIVAIMNINSPFRIKKKKKKKGGKRHYCTEELFNSI